MSDTSGEAKSDSWPMFNEKQNKPKEVKRRFSWENLTKSKDSKKRSKSKRRHRKFMSSLDFSAKKQSPKSKPTFKTSTPLKAAKEEEMLSKASENSFGNSISISQVTFNKPASNQTTTCSDRFGKPKTSLNDFKKLLLNVSNKKLTAKPSAVEQLKLKHDALNSTSPMKILDLSSSPKSFMNRRIQQLQPSQTLNTSPYKKVHLMSPRSRWKYSNFSKSSIASIPEANIEDDVIDIQQNEIKELNTDVSFTNPLYATPKRKLSTVTENVVKEVKRSIPQTSNATTESLEPIIAKTESSPETGIIETNFSMEENIFLQAEENNFMKGEIKPYGGSFGKKLLLTPDNMSQNLNEEPNVLATPTLETSF